MKKLVLGALFGLLAACGGGKSTVDSRIVVQDSTTVDAGDACNVLADTGCQATQKCTWIIDLWTGQSATGHVGCATAGTVALGGACKIGTGGMMPTGSDDCAKGLYCNSGVCKTVCDPNGGAPMCGENLACAQYNNSFSNEGEAAKAGVCDPTCDPLTNKVDGTNEANCKGMLDTAVTNVPGLPTGYPNRGCYGFWDEGGRSRWSCAGSGPKTALQDFEPARAFINACAPGYGPLLAKMSGSMQAICSAMCNPGDAFMGQPATEIGGKKRGTDFSTCNDRGAVGMDCVHGWQFEIAADNTITETKYSTLGVCIQFSRYTSSSTTMPGPLKACKDIPSNTDPAMDQAYRQGCRPLSAHPLLPGPIKLPFAATLRNHIRPAFPMTLSAE